MPEPANPLAAPLVTTMSSAANPVTASSNVNVTVKSPFCGPSGPPIVTVGAVRSTVISSATAGVLPTLSPLRAASAGTSTVTVPSKLAVGVIVAVYVAPEPVRLPAAPLPTEMSPTPKPVTDSLNVNVTSNAPFTGLDCELVMVTVGMDRLAVTESCAAAVLPWPAASSAACAPTSTVTSPLDAGVMLAVYLVPEPDKSPTVPLPTAMSESAKPVTASLNVNVTVKAPVCVPPGPVISSVGAVRSTVTARLAAPLPLPSPSSAAPAATSTVTEPSNEAPGVMVAP